jgi:hypothetical protein
VDQLTTFFHLMRIERLVFLVPLAITLGSAPVLAQSADSVSAAAIGAREGTAAGHSASMSGVRWGSAAATFFLTPILGGAVVLARSGSDPGDVPSLVPPPPTPVASTSLYERAYRDAYRAEYLPRRRHTMRSAMIVTSVLFVGAVAAIGG